MPAPRTVPLGLKLAQTARTVTNAFNAAMAEHDASAATWQVLVLLRSQQGSTQSQIADALGIRGATLTHHLNALERQGLVRRWRDDANRRVQLTELTDEGIALFDRLRKVATAHDARLRAALTPAEAEQLGELLDKLRGSFSEG